jgi:uncharacterized protein YjfI (DUF2170 family)
LLNFGKTKFKKGFVFSKIFFKFRELFIEKFSMKYIEIKKDGEIFKHEVINDKDIVEKVDVLSAYLAFEIEVEDGTKFKTLFNLMFKEKDFFNKLFSQELKGMTFQDYQKQITKKPNLENNKNEEGEELVYLEVAKMFELLTFDGGNTIDLFTAFVGIGKCPHGEDGVYMPASLSPINDLKNYDIVINKSVEILQDTIDENGEPGLTPLMTAFCSISVYEALQAIIYEISYYGTPENKIKQKQEFSKKVKLEDRIFELEQSLHASVKNEEYEKAASIKKELGRLKNKKEKNA